MSDNESEVDFVEEFEEEIEQEIEQENNEEMEIIGIFIFLLIIIN